MWDVVCTSFRLVSGLDSVQPGTGWQCSLLRVTAPFALLPNAPTKSPLICRSSIWRGCHPTGPIRPPMINDTCYILPARTLSCKCRSLSLTLHLPPLGSYPNGTLAYSVDTYTQSLFSTQIQYTLFPTTPPLYTAYSLHCDHWRRLSWRHHMTQLGS